MNNIAGQIKSALSIQEVAERYGVEVNRKGYASCPFHGEKTPSLKLYPDSNSFYCFGCGTGGDVITFVVHLFRIEFQDALKKIDFDYGLCLYEKPTLTQYRKQKAIERDRKIEMERKQAQKAYDRYAYKRLVEYYWWLKEQPDSPAKERDIAYMDRLTEQFLSPDVPVPLDVDALISALKSKYESEV